MMKSKTRSRSKSTLIASFAVGMAACHGGATKPDDAPKAPAVLPLDLVVVVEGHQVFVGPEEDRIATAYDEVVRALDAIPKGLPPDARITLIVQEFGRLDVRVADAPPARFTGAALGPRSALLSSASPSYDELFDQLRHPPVPAGRRRAILEIATGCSIEEVHPAKRDARLAALAADHVRFAAALFTPEFMVENSCWKAFEDSSADLHVAYDAKALPDAVAAALSDLVRS